MHALARTSKGVNYSKCIFTADRGRRRRCRRFIKEPRHAMAKRPRTPPPSSPPPAADEVELFRQAVGSVRPLPPTDVSAQRAPPPAPRPRQFELDEARVLDELLAAPADALALEPGEALAFLRDGHDPRLLQRLRRGQFAVQDEIDLHQMSLKAAGRIVRQFLAEAVAGDRRCVRIVHGKGLRSPAGPVLKAMVDRLLRHHGDVLAFASARPAEGGTGAVVVLLRSG
jgi:DNA-nicking Smr family endonuclease